MNFNRNQRLAKRIVLVDGLPHSGKSILGAIISSMDNSEQYVLMDKSFDYLLRIYHMKKISKDALKTFINIHVDYELNDLQLARNVNFNQSDASSIYQSLNVKRYEERTKIVDNENILSKIERNNPILVLMVHDAINFSKILHETLGERLLGHIFTQRHPLQVFFDILERRQTSRLFSDPRVFEIFLEKNNIPIEATIKNKQLYIDSNEYERIIYLILTIFPFVYNENYQKLSKSSKKITAFVPFEEFVVKPDKYIKRIANMLNTQTTDKTKLVLIKQNVPRNNNGLNLIDLKQKYNSIITTTKIADNYLDDFQQLIEHYEESIKSVSTK